MDAMESTSGEEGGLMATVRSRETVPYHIAELTIIFLMKRVP
jgi:hypothetical protein